MSMPSWYVTNHSGQLGLLPLLGQEIGTRQKAVGGSALQLGLLQALWLKEAR